MAGGVPNRYEYRRRCHTKFQIRNGATKPSNFYFREVHTISFIEMPIRSSFAADKAVSDGDVIHTRSPGRYPSLRGNMSSDRQGSVSSSDATNSNDTSSDDNGLARAPSRLLPLSRLFRAHKGVSTDKTTATPSSMSSDSSLGDEKSIRTTRARAIDGRVLLKRQNAVVFDRPSIASRPLPRDGGVLMQVQDTASSNFPSSSVSAPSKSRRKLLMKRVSSLTLDDESQFSSDWGDPLTLPPPLSPRLHGDEFNER